MTKAWMSVHDGNTVGTKRGEAGLVQDTTRGCRTRNRVWVYCGDLAGLQLLMNSNCGNVVGLHAPRRTSGCWSTAQQLLLLLLISMLTIVRQVSTKCKLHKYVTPGKTLEVESTVILDKTLSSQFANSLIVAVGVGTPLIAFISW